MNTEIKCKFRWMSVLWSLFFLLTASLNVHALGIGEANVLTSLGQSLRAEAPVFSSGQEDLTQLSVRLATQENFDRAGISFAHNLQQLNFSIQQKKNGRYVIEITSGYPINDPIVDFLVEVTWPEGRLHRQYTLFVDPPLFDATSVDEAADTPPDFLAIADETITPEVSAPSVDMNPDMPLLEAIAEAPGEEKKIELFAVEPPTAEIPITSVEPIEMPQPSAEVEAVIKPEPVQVQPVEEPTLVPEKSSPVLPFVEESQPLSANEVEVLMALEPDPVPTKSVKRMFSNLLKKVKRSNDLISPLGKTKSGDSLWKIANAARTDDSVTTQQVMLAIMETNPGAFTRNNVNTLKAGVQLKTPSAALVNSLTAAEAVQQMNEQNRDWNEYLDERRQKRQAAAEVKKQAEQTAAVDTKISGPRLKLVVPDATDQSISGKDQVIGEGGSDALTKAGQSLSSAAGGGDATTEVVSDEAAGTIDAEAGAVDNTEKINNGVLGLEQKETEKTGQSLAIHSEEFSSIQGEVNDDGLLNSIQSIIMDNLMYWVAAILTIILVISLVARRTAAKRIALETGLSDLFEGSKVDSDVTTEVYQDLSEEGLEPTLDITQLMNDVDELILQENWDEAQTALNDAMYKNPGQLNIRQKLIELHYKTSNKDAFIDQSKLFFMETGGGKGVNWKNVAEMGRHLASDHQLFLEQERGEEASFIDWKNDVEEVPSEDSHSDEGSVPEPLEKSDIDDFLPDNDSKGKALEDVLLDDSPGFIDDADPPSSPVSKEKKEQELIDQIQQDLEDFSSEGAQSEASDKSSVAIESSNGDYHDEDVVDSTVFEFLEADSDDSDALEVDGLETKLDVARVYMDMGSKKEAKRLLKELLDDSKATAEQHEQASSMLNKLG